MPPRERKVNSKLNSVIANNNSDMVNQDTASLLNNSDSPSRADMNDNQHNTITTSSQLFRVIVFSLIQGIGFGFFFERSHVFEPENIRAQFTLEKFLMIKMFFGAMAASCFSLLVILNNYTKLWKYYGTMAECADVKANIGGRNEEENRLIMGKLNGSTGGPESDSNSNISSSYYLYRIRSSIGIRPDSYTKVGLGGAILGAGMAVAGACPGMVLPQVGVGVENCAWVLFGGVLGCILFNLMSKVKDKLNSSSSNGTVSSSNEGEPPEAYGVKTLMIHDKQYIDIRYKDTLEKIFRVNVNDSSDSNYTTAVTSDLNSDRLTPGSPLNRTTTLFCRIQIVFFLMCVTVALVLELLIPYKDELRSDSDTSNDNVSQEVKAFRNLRVETAWYPSLCGFGLGCTSIIGLLNYSQMLGSTRAFNQVALLITTGTVNKRLSQWYQVPFLFTAIFGAYVSSKSRGTIDTSNSDNIHHSSNSKSLPYPMPSSIIPGIQPGFPTAFIGGVLMLFGAKLGAGCTSGQGMAATPLLNIQGMWACCTMFGAGIGVAMGMKGLKW